MVICNIHACIRSIDFSKIHPDLWRWPSSLSSGAPGVGVEAGAATNRLGADPGGAWSVGSFCSFWLGRMSLWKSVKRKLRMGEGDGGEKC